MKVRDYYVTPKSSPFMRFLWRAAGGDRYLLERATYSDQVKYMCLGGIVFATGGMAGLAGGYAFYTVFAPKSADVLDKTRTLVDNTSYIPADMHSVLLATLFGIIWGLIIFNLDRFIVTSTGKGDGTEAITWDELKGAFPRIILGAIIALTISKPVEIRMFKTEIDLAVQKQQEKEKEAGIMQANANYQRKVAEVKTRMGKLQQDIGKKEAAIADLRSEISREITDKNKNGAGEGPRAEALNKQAVELESQLSAFKKSPEYLAVTGDLKKLDQQKERDIANAEKKAATLDGLLIRIQKAHEIAGPLISLFITLLFLAIELTPVFFKLMLTKTTYDFLAENRDELIKAEHGIEVRYDYYKNKQGQERHLVINHEADKMIYEKIKVTEIQKELTDYAVAQYREREQRNMEGNLDQYIMNMTPHEPDHS